jgi:protein-tyrosine phosphatase
MPSILLVCTGNICRSPMAEGFLRAALERRLGVLAPVVSSAGVYGRRGGRALPETITAAAERDVDLTEHVVRALEVHDVEQADLVIGMAAEHRDWIAREAPSASQKSFTLRELVRLLEALPATEPAGAVAAQRLTRRVAEADLLRREGFEGSPFDEDVDDPIGLSLEAFRAAARDIEEWTERLATGLFGPPSDREVGPGLAGRRGVAGEG